MDENKDIELRRPIKINGVETKVLRMREPTVRDQLSASKLKGDTAEKEMAMFANLCSVAPEELMEMLMVDYTKLQEAYASFFD